MSKKPNPIVAELCHDHFERVCAGTVCDSCPSKADHEDVVKSLSNVLKQGDQNYKAAVLSELRSIRRIQASFGDSQLKTEEQIAALQRDVKKIDDSIRGNGSRRGILNRLVALETKDEAGSASLSTLLVVIGLIISSLVGAAGLVVSLFAAMS